MLGDPKPVARPVERWFWGQLAGKHLHYRIYLAGGWEHKEAWGIHLLLRKGSYTEATRSSLTTGPGQDALDLVISSH